MKNLGRLIFGTHSPFYFLVCLFMKAEKVGVDHCGNRYFRGKARKGYSRERRWVMYEGTPDASKVPPEWHGWLHHQTDVVPNEDGFSFRKKWQKPHRPNLTGSTAAYMPPGHPLKAGQRPPATGDYKAWKPGSSGSS